MLHLWNIMDVLLYFNPAVSLGYSTFSSPCLFPLCPANLLQPHPILTPPQETCTIGTWLNIKNSKPLVSWVWQGSWVCCLFTEVWGWYPHFHLTSFAWSLPTFWFWLVRWYSWSPGVTQPGASVAQQSFSSLLPREDSASTSSSANWHRALWSGHLEVQRWWVLLLLWNPAFPPCRFHWFGLDLPRGLAYFLWGE